MADGKPPLRVLQIASSLYEWGGIERYVVYLTQGLESRGHSVTVACPPGSPIAERVKHSRTIEMRRKLDLRGFASYVRLFRRERFDVVHAHYSPDFTLPAYAARITRQPLKIITRHLATRWNPAQVKSYGNLWDHIIPVSEAVENRLAEAGIPRSQMTVAKAGLPSPKPSSTREQARRALGIGEDVLAVGSFGRLVPAKGVEVLIDGVPKVEGGHAYIFGSGPSEAELRTRAGQSGRITFIGQVTDVANAMLAMDVIAIPSTWDEPFPYSALEAMALARPIAASRIGGLPEMVEDGTNGRLFVAGDAQDLARVLNEMTPGDRQAMGQAGHARYKREFTIDHMAARIEDVYSAQRREGRT